MMAEVLEQIEADLLWWKKKQGLEKYMSWVRVWGAAGSSFKYTLLIEFMPISLPYLYPKNPS